MLIILIIVVRQRHSFSEYQKFVGLVGMWLTGMLSTSPQTVTDQNASI